MITITDVAEGILNGYSYQQYFRLQSWLGSELLAEDIPAVNASEELDATLRVPERLTFEVPVVADAVSWVPTSFSSPLGAYGQRITAQIGLGVGSGAIEWMNRGVFLLESAETAGNSISVEAVGLLQLVDEAELATEYQPKASATLKTILRAMVEPGITIDFDSAPTDRTAPTGITWSDSRLDNVYSVLDAWPAQARITENGHLEVTAVPSDPTTVDVVFDFTDGTGGTAMEYNTSITRDGAFNSVVAKGQYPDTAGAKAGQEIIATSYDTDPDSPYRYGGPFSPYLVPFGYESPLMTTLAKVQEAGNTRLRTLRLKASRTVQITCVPHPALQLGDAVSVTSIRLGLDGEVGRIQAMTLPYSPEGGAMQVTVRLTRVG